MSWRIGVDSGGTFTDVCLFNDHTGQLDVWKVSSTPRDPSVGIAQGVSDALSRFGALGDDVTYLGHGTTVATNALIQKRGALTGLITSDGFRDLLEIGRQKRPSLYDMQADKPETLVRRDLRYEAYFPQVANAIWREFPPTVAAEMLPLRRQAGRAPGAAGRRIRHRRPERPCRLARVGAARRG